MEDFGITPEKIIAQLGIWFLFVSILVIQAWASYKVVRTYSGAAIPLWLLLIWLLPPIGAIFALISLNFKTEQDH